MAIRRGLFVDDEGRKGHSEVDLYDSRRGGVSEAMV